MNRHLGVLVKNTRFKVKIRKSGVKEVDAPFRAKILKIGYFDQNYKYKVKIQKRGIQVGNTSVFGESTEIWGLGPK